MSLADLIQNVTNGGIEQTGVFTKARLQDLEAYLAGHSITELRVLVASTPGLGHQSNTIAILKRIITLGFNAKVRIVYKNDTGDTLGKLAVLLPGFHPKDPTPYMLDGVELTFVNWNAVDKLASQPFGITGGWDELDGGAVLRRLNVELFLRLEPFGWTVPSAVWQRNETTVLNHVDALGRGTFDQRAYYTPVPTLTDAQWDALFEIPGVNAEMLHIAELIDGYLQPGSDKLINFMPVYGIGTPQGLTTLPGTSHEILFNIVAAVAYAQSNGTTPKQRRPAVVAVLSELSDDTWAKFKAIVVGNLRLDQANAAAYITAQGLSNRIIVQDSDDVELFEANMQALTGAQILVVTLPRPPLALFNLLYAEATLPPVFEGKTTANLMLNLGRPYIHLASAGKTVYPSLLLGSQNVSGTVDALTWVMANLTEFLANWSEDPAQSPAVRVGKFILTTNPNQPAVAYFKKVGAFYQAEQNDKLLIALFYVLPEPWSMAALPAPAAAAKFDLQAFYKTLTGAVKACKLDLTAVLGSDQVASFLAVIASETHVVVDGVDIQFPAPQTAITVTGTSDAFGVPGLTFQMVFCASDAGTSLAAEISLTGGGFSFDAAPWFRLTKTKIVASLADDGGSVGGTIGGTIALGDSALAVSFSYPNAQDLILLSGTFDENPPSIGDVFALLGGINFVDTLPQPLQNLSSIALQSCEVEYDFAARTVNGFNVVLATLQDWPLFGKLSIAKGMSVRIIVSEPTGSRSVAWIGAGALAIGAGSLDVGVRYPDLSVTAQLADDSKPIALADLFTFFLPPDIQAPIAGNVSALSLQVTPGPPTSFSVSSTVDLQWTIPSSQPIFTIESLGFHVSNGGGGAAGSFTGIVLILPESAKIRLLLTATYASANGWTFDGQQTSGVVSLGDLLHHYLGWDTGGTMGIVGLGLTIATKDNSWTFTGKTAESWTVPFINGLSVAASLKAGWNAPSGGAQTLPALAGSSVATALTVQDGKGGYFARIETEWTWENIDLKIFFDYAPDKKSFGITWDILEGLVEGPDADGGYTSTLRFTESATLGSIVQTMVSWSTGSKFSLASPWDLLDSISLSNLALIYTFNANDSSRNHVSLEEDIGPIELGFARIDSIGLSYKSTGTAEEKGVIVTLNGSFRWQDDPSEPLGWDATKPETTPAPPGNGNKYIDLRLLVMGQHVMVPGLASVTDIQAAIALMRDFPDKPDILPPPPVVFDAGSAWLVGVDFGLMKIGGDSKGGGGEGSTALVGADDVTPADDSGGYVVTLQVVFNDPVLYGLRIALAGDGAKIFKGLDFQIMYRQVSPTVGVYQAEITLPDAARYLTVGAYSITLPVFAIQVYTNGDFLVDIGFPWNSDFSRSFSIEAIIPPGIPLLGSAGLYFGKLSSATTNKVPQATNGAFNPVILFGFGMQVGFGKSIHYGILSAGFSVTMVGLLEGVIAKWNPYQIGQTGGQPASQLQGEYYFWLQGTVGLLGKVFGSVDFAIVKADVDITIKLLLQLTYESYVAITISVSASVSVSVSVRINLGLFKITIHFSFSMRLSESFTIDIGGTAPWQVAALAANPTLRRHRQLRLALVGRDAGCAPSWSNLVAAASAVPLTGYFVPGLTVAGDEWGSAQPADQPACAVAMLVIESVPPAGSDGSDSLGKAAGEGADSSFELLAKMVLRWAVAAIQPGPITSAAVDALAIDDADLDRLASEVLVSSDAQPTPLQLADIDTFLAGQFSLSIALPDSTLAKEVDATYFPVPAQLSLAMPAYGGSYPGYSYSFGTYNALGPGVLSNLRTYFDQLAVKVQQEMQPRPHMAAPTNAPLSVSGWMFSDYFLLVARQMVKAVQEALRSFQYPIASGDTPDSILAWVNTQGNLTGELAYSLGALFAANATHPLTAFKPLAIGVTAAPTSGATFETLATLFAQPLTGITLALANAAQAGVLANQAVVTVGADTFTIQAGDTLCSVAKHFGLSVGDLLAASDVLTSPAVLSGQANLLFPFVTVAASASDSLASIAGAKVWSGGFDAPALATTNAGNPVLRPGAKISYPGIANPYLVQSRDSLGDVANALGVSLAQLLTNSDVLSTKDLLAPAATLFVPAFTYQTATDDTLGKVATFFGVDLAVTADAAANGSVADLFATSMSDGTATPTLSLPHLPCFPVGALIAEAQRSGALQHLSGMVSRYMLHGMRLPTAGITPNAPGMWVRGSGANLSLPQQLGLYALSGQQFPLPVLDTSNVFSVTLGGSTGPTWLKLTGGKTPNALTLTITPGSDFALRLGSIRDCAHQKPFAIPVDALGGGDMYHAEPVSYPFSSAIAWQSAGSVPMPYVAASIGVPALRIWHLPYAMASLPDPKTRKVDPRFALKTATFSEATGTTLLADVASYGWASMIAFTVKRIETGAVVPSSPAATSAVTYEIVGAGGADTALLERLVAEVGSDDGRFANVILCFATENANGASQGLASDPPDQVTFGIAQVNLSTDTHPPAMTLGVGAMPAQAGPLELLNKPSAFVRLLWEASITASGGFYLYYFDAASGRGLPDRLFNDRNEANLTLLLLYGDPGDDTANRVTDYMNAAVTADRIDTGTALFAQADPLPVALTATAADSLKSLAQAYFDSPADIAEANATARLVAGSLTVAQGVVQAPPGGIALAPLAANFATTVAALNAANPGWSGGLPDPLPYPSAIRLPSLTIRPGISPQSASLAEIAGYYGETPSALGADNADVAGLFAGQTVTVNGGPHVRAATVGPGIQSVAAQRVVPPPIPDDPSDSEFGEVYLLNAFSLLGQRVFANPDFGGSNQGLPAGPTVLPPADAPSGKTLAAVAEGQATVWNYANSLPYYRFAKTSGMAVRDGLPDPALNPYVGVSRLLQIWFDWQDQFGNRLVTTLSDARSGDATPRNARPIPTGYSDPIVALGQWPSVASSWIVAPASGKPELQVALSFDPGRYQGVISAEGRAPTTVVASFTDPLDPTAAADIGKYQILPDKPSIQSATLGSDQRTVTLTLATALSDTGIHTLIVSDIKSAGGGAGFGGQAQFAVPDDPSLRTSSVQQAAQTALATLQKLYYQLTDLNGFALAVESTLLVGQGHAPGQLPVDQADVDALMRWLFSGSSTIYAFLQDRAQFGISVLAPTGGVTIGLDLGGAPINAGEIFELWLNLVLTRTGGAVTAGLETTPGIRSAATRIAPLQDKTNAGSTLGLTTFAASVEGSLSTSTQLLKVAVGANRTSPGAGAATGLWLVRIGLGAGESISFASVEAGGSPTIFAPAPVANQLQTHQAVPIYDYTSAGGIASTSHPVDFVDIDVDGWCEQIFASIDEVLSPLFTASMQILGKWDAEDYLQRALDAKEAIAWIASAWMIPVFTDPGDLYDGPAAQKAFRQQLLSRLSNAYTTRAAVQYAFKVDADVGEENPPRLFGTVGGPRPAFLWANISSDDKMALYLTFSDPLDPVAAVKPANYLLPGGVVAMSASLDGSVVTLTLSKVLASNVTATVLNLTDIRGRALVGVLERPVMASAYSPPAISLSSPKLELATAAANPLTFLVSSPGTVHSESGGVAKSIGLDLVYSGQQIEHQIARVTAIKGYEESSWLSFVVPMDAETVSNPLVAPLTAPGAPLEIPLVLRAFPTTPTMERQLGPSSYPLDQADLEQVLLWDYEAGYALPFHYPQDRISGAVNFNLREDVVKAMAMLDKFDDLAEFVTVLPAVGADLLTYLARIDATTDPGADAVQTSRIALKAFLWLIEGVAGTRQDTAARARRASPLKLRAGDPTLTFQFQIEESAMLIDGASALLVTITAALAPGMTQPPRIDILPDTYEAVAPPDQPVVAGSYVYVYRNLGTGTYLDNEKGQTIPGRILVLPQLDILQRQDASGEIYVERNVDLVMDRTTADPFVYGTAPVSFAEPLFPTNGSSAQTDISLIGSTAVPPTPVVRSLQAHLEALFTAVLAKNVQEVLTIQVEASYAYPLNPSLSDVSLPVLFQPPLAAPLTGNKAPIPEKMIKALAESITLWFATRVPQGGGTLWFDLTILSSETAQPMPLLRMRKLFLSLSAIQPPLNTLS